MVAVASTLPAAAMVWPTSDFVELTRTPPSPKTPPQREGLGAVVLRGAGAVGVDVADLAGRQARVASASYMAWIIPSPSGCGAVT